MHVVVEVDERCEGASAAFDEERGGAVDEHEVGAGGASGSAPERCRPRERRPVGLGRIGGGQHQRLALAVMARLAQTLERAGQGELRATEALDEVAAAGRADRLEGGQLGIDAGEAAGQPLGLDGRARGDAVTVEQDLGLRAGTVGLRRAVEERRGKRPAAAGRSSGGGAAAAR